MFGPRFVVEAIFLAVVALAAGFAGLEWTAIVLVMVLAYLLVVVFDVAVSRTGAWPGQSSVQRRREPTERPAVSLPPTELEPRHVHVVSREPDPAAQPVLTRVPDRIIEPELEPEPAAEPISPVAELELAEPPAPEPEPEPGPEPPQLEVVPEPEPEPEPPEPEPEPEAPRVVALPLSGAPREWNVWELERLARASSGGDVVKDEELSYLLVYLRGFATPEGTLPVDFDELVRESFGSLLVAR